MADFIPPALHTASSSTEKAAIIADFVLDECPENVAFVARRCVVLHWFNREIVEAILQNTQSDNIDVEDIYKQLCSLPFIEILPWGLTLQDLTREGLLARYATTQPEILKDGARIAASVYKSHTEDSKILAEALFCSIIAEDRDGGAMLLEKLLTEACNREDWRYIRNIFNLQKEAEKFPGVLPLPRSRQQLLLQNLVHKAQSRREVGTDKLFSRNAKIAHSYQSYQFYPPTLSRYASPPYVPPARSNARSLIIMLVVLVILASSGAIVVPYAKTQIDHSNATATASTYATSTAVTQYVQATGTAQAIAEATAAVVTANPNPYPPQTGTLVLLKKVPLVEMGTSCDLINGTIHVTSSYPGSVGYCWGGNSYDNFAYDVEMTIVKGDCGGIIFREDGTEGSKEYMFNVCQYGYHTVDIGEGATQQFKNITYAQTTPGLKQGLNQMNLIGVVAQDQNISVYVNKQQVASFTDGTYSSGSVGVDVWNTNSNGTDVSFANQRVWKL